MSPPVSIRTPQPLGGRIASFKCNTDNLYLHSSSHLETFRQTKLNLCDIKPRIDDIKDHIVIFDLI